MRTTAAIVWLLLPANRRDCVDAVPGIMIVIMDAGMRPRIEARNTGLG